jgi:hypothetical protein
VDLEDKTPLTPLNESPTSPVEDRIPPYDDRPVEKDHEEDEATTQGVDLASDEMPGDGKAATSGAMESAAAEFALISKFADADSVASEEAEEAVPVKGTFLLEYS